MTFTEELALKQAAKADREIAAGKYRGPLHGIPWGAKDLIAYPGYPTTWGATPFKDRVIDVKATVAARLEEAGAVHGRQALAGCTRDGRPLVWRPDAQSLGPADRLERVVGRLGLGGRGGLGRLRDRQRNAGQHRLSLPRLRRIRPAADLRPGQPARLHDALVVDGQARADRPLDRGLRTHLRRDPRRRRTRLGGRRPAVRVAAEGRPRRHQGRLHRRARPADRQIAKS